MTAIKAADVKALRDKTQAGMMDCKKALQEADGDMQKAVNILRERGIAKGEKRGGRATTEGQVCAKVAEDKKSGALAGLSCETDFTARNADTQALAEKLAAAALASEAADSEALASQTLDGGQTIADAVQARVAATGENTKLVGVAFLKVEGEGIVDAYIHPPGKIGVLVALEASSAELAAKPELQAFAQELCMHVAAESPRFLKPEDVDQATIDNEREVYRNIAIKEGKPEKIIDRIVEGSVKKFYKDACLLEQEYVLDPGNSVAAALQKRGKELGGKIEIAAFSRFAIGEGEPESADEEGEG